ncbi:MAG: TIGR02300 family protein [Alphaproteobacteria bacterium]|nr:TIGR02300 family protein [Alphaproteobacteria bacterium]
MAKVEWGTKRICHSCGARFYDLRREEIVCPKCGTEYDPEAVLKSRRSRPQPDEKPAPQKKKAPVAPVVAGDEADAATEEIAPAGEEAEEAEDAIIEDTSDLGEDEDDVAEVIDNVDDEEER